MNINYFAFTTNTFKLAFVLHIYMYTVQYVDNRSFKS